MLKGIDHFAISSTDTTKLTNWYVSVLDFQIIYTGPNVPPTYMIRARNGTVIEIISAPNPDLPVGDRDAHGFHHFALASDDFDSDYEKLKSQDVEMMGEPAAGAGGAKIAFMKDPEGNIFQLADRSKPL